MKEIVQSQENKIRNPKSEIDGNYLMGVQYGESTSTRHSLWLSNVGEEPGRHTCRCARFDTRHWRQHRDLQRRTCGDAWLFALHRRRGWPSFGKSNPTMIRTRSIWATSPTGKTRTPCFLTWQPSLISAGISPVMDHLRRSLPRLQHQISSPFLV